MASIANVVGARFSYNPSSLKNHQTSKPLIKSVSCVSIKAEAINPQIRKDEAKVVDFVVASELAKPLTAYCRCWRSGTFPLCDGSHVKFNKESGDNVGLCLSRNREILKRMYYEVMSWFLILLCFHDFLCVIEHHSVI
ncbi:hypothetical protein ACHQM5_001348 [Ranunculus cassubicifolius]